MVARNASLRAILEEQVAAWGVRTNAVENEADALEKLQKVARFGNPESLLWLDV